MGVGWWNEQLNCAFKITKLPFWTAPWSSLQKVTLPGENNWRLWALKNGLNTHHEIRFTSSKKQRKRKEKLKIAESEVTKIPYRIFFLAAVWSEVHSEYCVTHSDTEGAVRCLEHGGCLHQQSFHIGTFACGVSNGMSHWVQARSEWITHNALSNVHNASAGT